MKPAVQQLCTGLHTSFLRGCSLRTISYLRLPRRNSPTCKLPPPHLLERVTHQHQQTFVYPHYLRRLNSSISAAEFEHISEETLESLCEKFEEMMELPECPDDVDVTYASGVLTAKLGADHGTYVINKQTPNAQIWLSSPTSGPKRYDFINNRWVYKHDDTVLHELLTNELSKIFKSNKEATDFSKCLYS